MPSRWARLARWPVEPGCRPPGPAGPRSNRASTRCEPMKPAPPVTRTRPRRCSRHVTVPFSPKMTGRVYEDTSGFPSVSGPAAKVPGGISVLRMPRLAFRGGPCLRGRTMHPRFPGETGSIRGSPGGSIQPAILLNSIPSRTTVRGLFERGEDLFADRSFSGKVDDDPGAPDLEGPGRAPSRGSPPLPFDLGVGTRAGLPAPRGRPRRRRLGSGPRRRSGGAISRWTSGSSTLATS